MKIYISGGITGIPDYKERFAAMETLLKGMYPESTILNPCRHPEGLDWDTYMRYARIDVETCTDIVLLPDWKKSRGSMLEVKWGFELNKNIWNQ